MEHRIITKNSLAELLSDLTKTSSVLAPVRQEDSLVFQEIHGIDEISFSDNNTKKSVKELFFPQREELFAYKDNVVTEPDLPDKGRVLFGVRPCDAKSLSLLDCVFDDNDYQDPYFLNKRENTLVVAVGCNRPGDTCFCTAIGGGPFSTEGIDLLLIDIGDAYLAQPTTPKGEEFIKEQAGFHEAKPDQIELKEIAVQKAEAGIDANLNLSRIKENLDSGFDSHFWESFHEKCIGCGTCTFLCPTCHCFDILDEGADQGQRIRIWDSCMFPLFTLHASGSNPRPTGKQRFRQRVMHKFKYFVENNGRAACTGCGRCIRYCPVNLDIRDVLGIIDNQE